MQLHPREVFTIVRQIEDHTDPTTYYVRAVVRNAKTDALIETLDLTDQGDRRFTKNWMVPADVSGQGFWVSILTSVYTDSGYTTKSQNYGDKMETYLVQDRLNANLNQGGGGVDVDYKKVRKIVGEELDKRPMPEIPEVIEVVKEVVPVINIPETKMPEPVDLAPILKLLIELRKAIANINFAPEIKVEVETDLEEIKSAINDNKDNDKLKEQVELIKNLLDSFLGNKNIINGKIEDIHRDNIDTRVSTLMGKSRLFIKDQRVKQLL